MLRRCEVDGDDPSHCCQGVGSWYAHRITTSECPGDAGESQTSEWSGYVCEEHGEWMLNTEDIKLGPFGSVGPVGSVLIVDEWDAMSVAVGIPQTGGRFESGLLLGYPAGCVVIEDEWDFEEISQKFQEVG